MNMKRPVYPVWYDGKRINETVFCREFLKDYPMKCVNDTFFTVLGPVNDERKLRKAIFEKISPYVSTGLNRQVTNIMDVLRLECASAELPVQTDRIHVANGTLHLMGTFTREMEYCRNRLPVAYNSNAPVPERWLAFLHELLEDEDIMTLQEFMGYCLIPSNKGQKMLLITGKGGEGKSRIGIVMRSLLGANMNTGSIAKVESDRFARADLEHKLLMLDDDVKMESLPQASTLKAIITAELPMDLEKKGKQSYQGLLYSRFLVLGNGTIKAQNDTSYGFFHRQIILTVKERDSWRKDDPFLAERLIAEKEGILLWCIEGLRRLMAHDFAFTVSAKQRRMCSLRNPRATIRGTFWYRRAISNWIRMRRSVPNSSTRHMQSGAGTMRWTRSRAGCSEYMSRRTPRSSGLTIPITSISAVDAWCADIRASGLSDRCVQMYICTLYFCLLYGRNAYGKQNDFTGCTGRIFENLFQNGRK